MGSRDHSTTCETCGAQRGGLNDYRCVCDDQAATGGLTPLEAEVADLRGRLAEVEERVRLDATAHEFLRGEFRVRQGDYFLINGFPTRLESISSEGRWTYFNGRSGVEPFRVPPSNDIQRLYTAAEVAEIAVKVRQETLAETANEVIENAPLASATEDT